MPMKHYSRYGNYYIEIDANRMSKIVESGLNERSE